MEEDKEFNTVQRASEGDPEAFRELVERYGDRIFSLLTGITGNRLDAEELTSDVFLKAFTHLDRFRGECRFSTWLYRIAYNTAISHTRRRRPRTVEINDRQYELPDDQEEILFR